MHEHAAPLSLTVACPSCGEHLLLLGERYKFSRPCVFAVRCLACGTRIPLAEMVGMLHTVKRLGEGRPLTREARR